MNAQQPIVIYGAGGFAREVAWLAEACAVPLPQYKVLCFIDDNPAATGKLLNDIPVLSLAEAAARFPGVGLAVGIGAPRTRELLTTKACAAGFTPVTLIHPRVERSHWISYGAGVVICAGNILTTNIQIGNHVQINLDCTIGHDVVMADYATLAPGVHVSGCVQIGRRAYIGTGAVIINGTQEHPIIIGDDAVVGAGACVARSVAVGVTVVGVPAKPLQR